MKGIIWLAIAVLLVWSATSLATGTIYVTAPTNALSRMMSGATADGLWYLSAAGTAIASLLRKQRPSRMDWTGLLLLTPSLATFIMAVTSSSGCVLNQQYADTVARPWGFILRDQSTTIVVGLFLFAAVTWVHCKPALSTFSLRSRG